MTEMKIIVKWGFCAEFNSPCQKVGAECESPNVPQNTKPLLPIIQNEDFGVALIGALARISFQLLLC